MNWTRLKADIKRHEGVRLKPYTDTVGKVTIGVGRNLTDVGISESEAETMLANDLERAVKAARAVVYSYEKLGEVRQEALVNMAFNLGRQGLAGFRKAIMALGEEDFARASDEFLDSKWASQVGPRAQELAQRIRTGTVEG
jgi:lysozyme